MGTLASTSTVRPAGRRTTRSGRSTPSSERTGTCSAKSPWSNMPASPTGPPGGPSPPPPPPRARSLGTERIVHLRLAREGPRELLARRSELGVPLADARRESGALLATGQELGAQRLAPVPRGEPRGAQRDAPDPQRERKPDGRH